METRLSQRRKGQLGTGSQPRPFLECVPLVTPKDTMRTDPRPSTGLVALFVNGKSTGAWDQEGVRIAQLPEGHQFVVRFIDGRDIGCSKIENRPLTFEAFGNVKNLSRMALSLKDERN